MRQEIFLLYLCKAVLACYLHLCSFDAARAKCCCSEIVLCRPVLCWSAEKVVPGPGATAVTFSTLYYTYASLRDHLHSTLR